MKIKEICEKTGLTDKAVRYYIEEKLITPFYTENYLGRKSFDFSEQDLAQLQNISTLRAFGFSIEEIKQLCLGQAEIGQIVEAVKKRTGECFDESRRRLDVLSSLELSDQVEFSQLAQKLSSFDPTIKNEPPVRNLKKRFLSLFRACTVFLAVWLPIVSAIMVLILKGVTLHMPIVRPSFFVYTLLSFFPSMVTVLAFQRLKGSRRMLRILLTTLCVLCLPLSVFFSSKSVIVCDHQYQTYRTVAQATCQSEGEEIVRCKVCGNFQTQRVEKLSHVPVVVKGFAPTCFKVGLSEGSNCSLCNMVLSAQITLPVTNIHTSVAIDAAVPATCKTTGLTEGSHCTVCNKVLVEQTVVPITEDHTPVTDAAVPATCKATGLTEGSHCSVCNKVLVAQTTVPKTEDHTPVTDAAVPATCKDAGLTEGSHCLVCNKIFVEQVTIPSKNDHKFVRLETGWSYECSQCGFEVIEHGNADGSLAGGNNRVKYYVTGDWENYKNFEIVIYGEGAMPNFSEYILPPWHGYLYNTVKITIKEGITSIGRYAFYDPDAIGLCNFVMASSVKTIKSHAISLNIKNIVLGDGVEFVESFGIGNIDSIYVPRSVKKLYIGVLESAVYFYEGTLEEFYKIELYIYNQSITVEDYIAMYYQDHISGIHIYLQAKNISDTSHYWR
ncbi:MAG: MerR family transcriptional regulator [Clostridia bacterium]|nr:MerR family transcriptional regulator [Clostridia bacterium]